MTGESQPDAAVVPVNDLTRALHDQRDELIEALSAVVDSGWLVHGPQHSAFEAEFAEWLGVTHVAGVASGTDALELALRAVTERPIVVTSANCGGYSSTAARRAGFGVRFADVDPSTHLLTAHTLEPVLDRDVGAVVVTHLYGRAADITAIRDLCAPQGIRVVEDCAQAVGATLPEGRVGTVGDVAAFSFYPTKNLGALGDGGAIATSDSATDNRVRQLRQYGWERKYQIGLDGGRNSRLDELQAAVLRYRLPRVDVWNARRREILTRYAASANDAITVLPAVGSGHVAHLAVVICDRRAALATHLADRGVRTDIHYPLPDHRQPAFLQEYDGVTLPVTERLATRVLSLPLFPELREDEIERVCAALREFRP